MAQVHMSEEFEGTVKEGGWTSNDEKGDRVCKYYGWCFKYVVDEIITNTLVTINMTFIKGIHGVKVKK